MKIRKNILKIVNNQVWFCLSDPVRVYKDCKLLLEEFINTYNLTKIPKLEGTIQRHLVLGITGAT